MEMTYFTLILCAALLVGIGLPGMIYFSSRKRKGVNEYDVFTHLMKRYRNAWTADQDEIRELSHQVEILREKRSLDNMSAPNGRGEDEQDHKYG